MKSALSVTPTTPAGEEPAGEVLAIRGGRPLTGRVEVKGAKNLVTKAMVAALLGGTNSVLRDVPDISDVQVVRSFLARRHGLDPVARARVASELARRLRPAVVGPDPHLDDEPLLEQLLAARSARG